MGRKKSKKKDIAKQVAIQTSIGIVFIFLGVVVAFGNKDWINNIFYTLHGELFIWLFSPVIIATGAGILFKRVFIDFRMIVGLLLFWVSAQTFLGAFPWLSRATGIYDISGVTLEAFGTVPVLLLALFGVLGSLWLLFDIPYMDLFTDGLVALKNSRTRESKKELKKETKADKKELQQYEKQTSELEKKIALLQSARDKQLSKSSKQSKKEKKVLIEKKTKSGVSIKQQENAKAFKGKWEYPSVDLLTKRDEKFRVDHDEIELRQAQIQKTLLDFGIEVDMVGYEAGPTVVQYQLRPRTGIKLSKIENLKKDLTLALHAKSIRIEAPIPGKGLVGIEVPNDTRHMVGIRTIIDSKEFKRHKSKLAMVLGKNISGDNVVGDLAKMPHLLVAGQTGSGKSVGVNAMLISLLYNNSPSELRFIMIDPKRVELSVYNGIPHLLTPVIKNADKALNALKWCVVEMTRRYEELTQARCRNLEEYNNKVEKKDRMPHIVMVIDELADLMMSGNKKDVENAITRIAQMARAVGMHLIVATQRPSVDVITGLIKANIPSRIAFTVRSQVDSRTIVDAIGADDLLGQGDMLFAPVGSDTLDRIQGVFVSTDEVESVVNHIKRTINPDDLNDIYDDTIANGQPSDLQAEFGDIAPTDLGDDESIVQSAIEIVRSSGKASTSMLQRRLKLGYARAARIMDILEEMGVVWPAEGSKPRQVL